MITEKVDALWVNVHLATMTEPGPHGIVKDGAIAIRGGKIAWLGKRIDLPADFESQAAKCMMAKVAGSLQGLWLVIPISSMAAAVRVSLNCVSRGLLMKKLPVRVVG